MNVRTAGRIIGWQILAIGLGAVFPAWAQAGAPPRPNVVFLLADDLGWSDISAHPGGTIKTPHIDQLSRQGVELRNFMGWCVCSPSRAMLLTGRHPFRVGTGPEVGGELDAGETTIADVFKSAGYRTGVFGKWHNGVDPDTPEFRAAYNKAFKDIPNKTFRGGLGVNEHGFDEAWVYYGGGADYFTRRTVGGRGPVSWWHNREYRPQDAGYTDDFVTRYALDFIRENKDRPFFCYVPFHIVHAPLQAKDEDLQGVDPKVTDKTKRTYAAMVQALDRNVATILAELDKLGLSENTIVVFSSDNGATLNGSNLPLRGGKHTLLEGGTHLPAVVYWPKGGLVGGRTWDGLCGFLDMMPTLAAMCEIPLRPARPLDGKNIWPALRDNQPSPVESYYWSWHAEDAIRTADWRMHRYFDHTELYDIRNDIGETKNVAAANPDVVKTLTGEMDAWARSLGAALTHQPAPAKLDAKPAPEGDVLEIRVTVSEKAQPKEYIVVPFANSEMQQFATDFIEYDVAVSKDTPAHGHWYYSPFKGNERKPIALLFKKGEGIDQFGRDQSTGPAVRGGPGVWEHRVIGLSSGAPGPLARNGVVFRGGKPGVYTIYLDNLRIRHADGSTTPVWTSGKDTKTSRMADNASFKDIRVRTVAASEVGK